MDNSQEILKQLKMIKYLLLLITLFILFVTAAFSYSTYIISTEIDDMYEDSSSCDDTDFRKEIKQMIEQGDFDKAIEYATKHLEKHPTNSDGYWFRGKAYYQTEKWQLAIDDFKMAEEISPNWKDGYTGPYIKQAEEQLQNANKNLQMGK